MKKWLLAPALVILAAFACIYLFIPARLNIVQITPINCTTPGAFRALASPDKWKVWWPGAPEQHDSLRFQHTSFVLTKTLINTFEIRVHNNESPVNSILHLIPLPGDSTLIKWDCSYPTGINPIKRIRHYQQAVALKNNMAELLGHFKSFAEKKENIYGISFHETVFRNSFLISTKAYMQNYPTVSAIYSRINDLKKYSALHQARQTGNPLVNIAPANPSGYQLMTALPIDKPIPASGEFFNQRIPLNHFLVTRVQGGDSSINHALRQFQLYVRDYHRTVMAIPFQQLITDRSAEPDTSRWITEIYFPLF